MVQCIKKKIRPSTAVKCFAWLLKFSEKPENLTLICEKGIGDRLIDVLSSVPFSTDEQVLSMVETGMMLFQGVARARKATTQHMDGIIKTMDTFKTRKGIVDVSKKRREHTV